MKAENLIEAINNFTPSNRRNSMGCSEDWYDFLYAMKETFRIEEIEQMSEHEIDLLYRLHDATTDGLY